MQQVSSRYGEFSRVHLSVWVLVGIPENLKVGIALFILLLVIRPVEVIV